MSTHVLNLLLKLASRAALGALEDHVLEEMGGAVGLVVLEAGPSVDPDTDGGCAGGEIGLGGDAEAVGEGGDAGGWGSEDGGVVGEGWVRGVVLQEAGVCVLETLELGIDGFGEAVVDHGGRGWRAGVRGGGDGRRGGGGAVGMGGGSGMGAPG